MTKKFKLRFFVIIMLVLVVLTSCLAFSVSYASWVNNEDKHTLTAGAGTGEWSRPVDPNWGNVVNGIWVNGTVLDLTGKINHGFQFWIELKPNDIVYFKYNGNVINCSNTDFNHCEILGTAYRWKELQDTDKQNPATINGIECTASKGGFKFLNGGNFTVFFNFYGPNNESNHVSIKSGHDPLSAETNVVKYGDDGKIHVYNDKDEIIG